MNNIKGIFNENEQGITIIHDSHHDGILSIKEKESEDIELVITSNKNNSIITTDKLFLDINDIYTKLLPINNTFYTEPYLSITNQGKIYIKYDLSIYTWISIFSTLFFIKNFFYFNL